jgi:hypothetical protein
MLKYTHTNNKMAYIMKPTSLCCILILSASLAACASEYQPDGDYGGVPHGGYSDEQINANTEVVRFNGNNFTNTGLVQSYLLYRAAQLTINNGYDYFVVVSTTMSPINVNLKTTDRTHYATEYPTIDTTRYTTSTVNSYSATSTNVIPGYAPCRADLHGAVEVIKMFSGKMPAGLPRGYTATDVIAHLGPAAF